MYNVKYPDQFTQYATLYPNGKQNQFMIREIFLLEFWCRKLNVPNETIVDDVPINISYQKKNNL